MKLFIERIFASVLSLGIAAQPLSAPMLRQTHGGRVWRCCSDGSSDDTGASAASLADASKSFTTRTIDLPKSSLTMDFVEADIRDVLHLLALKSGINIIYGPDVTGAVTIHLDRVPFDQAFQTVLTLKNLVALPMGNKILRVVYPRR